MSKWPPPPDFDEFLKSINPEAEFSFDPKAVQEQSGEDKTARYAGHCLIWAKTSKVMEYRRGDVPIVALVNVSACHGTSATRDLL